MPLTVERTPDAVWEECLDLLKSQLNGQTFKTWFEPITAASLREDADQLKLTVNLPSRFYYEWLEENHRGVLQRTVKEVLGGECDIYYAFDAGSREEEAYGAGIVPPNPPAESATACTKGHPVPAAAAGKNTAAAYLRISSPGPAVEDNLNDSHTFDSYIEGDCNRFARSAAQAVSGKPGTTTFNPLLVYGGVGLGKTHLIQAIGNEVRARRDGRTVLYVSSERFTTDFVQSIQHNRINEFSQFYRHIDVLIVDDVQFFGGKEKTQEEFFHIFNALHQSGRQIVLSADRPPKDIQGIEERLLSRFQWGLTADVQPPDLETRIAIAMRKVEEYGVDVPPDVIEFITNNIDNNVRELEGSLIRLLAHATLSHREIDLEMAKSALKDMVREKRRHRTIEDIQEIVADFFRISVDLVRARTRKREVVQARQTAMYFCKQLTGHSLKKIGLHFGGRDHSTVIHAIDAVENMIDTDPAFCSTVEDIRRKMNHQYL